MQRIIGIVLIVGTSCLPRADRKDVHVQNVVFAPGYWNIEENCRSRPSEYLRVKKTALQPSNVTSKPHWNPAGKFAVEQKLVEPRTSLHWIQFVGYAVGLTSPLLHQTRSRRKHVRTTRKVCNKQRPLAW